jgi:type II secretory pathway pseudopilin PulG
MIGRRNLRNGLTLFEFAVVLIIILIFAGTLLGFLYKAAIRAKEVTLQFELKNLRLALDLYKKIKGEYPQDLRLLIQTRYTPYGTSEIIFGQEFLEIVGTDKESYPIDPFGNRFYYNSGKGVVNSKAKGYENW